MKFEVDEAIKQFFGRYENLVFRRKDNGLPDGVSEKSSFSFIAQNGFYGATVRNCHKSTASIKYWSSNYKQSHRIHCMSLIPLYTTQYTLYLFVFGIRACAYVFSIACRIAIICYALDHRSYKFQMVTKRDSANEKEYFGHSKSNCVVENFFAKYQPLIAINKLLVEHQLSHEMHRKSMLSFEVG